MKTWSLLNNGEIEHEAESIPAVIVGVTDQAELEWQRRTYKEVTEVVRGLPSLDIIFFRSTYGLPGTRNLQCISLLPRHCYGPVPMGRSIGIGNGFENLGGLVKVRYQGQFYTMGLTCHHFHRHAAISTDEDINGLHPDLQRQSIKVYAPGDSDTKENIEDRSNAYRRLKEKFMERKPMLTIKDALVRRY